MIVFSFHLYGNEITQNNGICILSVWVVLLHKELTNTLALKLCISFKSSCRTYDG